ncbi:hypothetical protein C8J56DRAFT_136810 [Mycena floridula]|nr:hypothetical protein C8J56DRAFT_136810 [Mycena floridula]
MSDKMTLYTFSGSIWSAAGEIAAAELGYTDAMIDKKVIRIPYGENFDPSFLAINPNGTLSTLVAKDAACVTTTEVTNYLVAHVPNGRVKPGNQAVIELIHESKYDLAFAMLLARNEEELRVKSVLGILFLSFRKKAIEKYSAMPEAVAYKAFYEKTLASDGGLLAIYQGQAPAEVRQGFFEQSRVHFESLYSAIYEILPGILAVDGFLDSFPAEEDFHLGPWLCFLAFALGGQSLEDGLDAMAKAFGKPVPDRVAIYWNEWSKRPSWIRKYGGGLNPTLQYLMQHGRLEH